MAKTKRMMFGGIANNAAAAGKAAAQKAVAAKNQPKSMPMGTGLAKTLGVKDGSTINTPAFINKSPLPQAPVGGTKPGASDAQAALAKINAAKQLASAAAQKTKNTQAAPVFSKNMLPQAPAGGSNLGAAAAAKMAQVNDLRPSAPVAKPNSPSARVGDLSAAKRFAATQKAIAGKPMMKKGGAVKASSASKRADGCAIRGKTKA